MRTAVPTRLRFTMLLSVAVPLALELSTAVPASAQTRPVVLAGYTAYATAEPPLCEAGDLLRSSGQVAAAIAEYEAALLPVSDSTACALAGLTVIADDSLSPADDLPVQTQCDAALALGKAGQFQSATTDLNAIVAAHPDSSCATTDLGMVAMSEEQADCRQGQQLYDAGEYSDAKTAYEAAITSGAPYGKIRCAEDGLKDVADHTSNVEPSWWRSHSASILHLAAGFGLFLAILGAIGVILLFAGGWIGRLLNRFIARFFPERSFDVRLVPQVKVNPFTGTSDSSPTALTSMLQTQMQAVQTSDDLALDFTSSDSKVQGMVTAVKDLNSTVGSVGEILLVLVSLGFWPWRTIAINGQTLPSGAQGEGLTVSVGLNARAPSGTQFWRYPNQTKAATNTVTMQNYYDLVPAVATWAVYESARLGGTADRELTEAGARCHGYLAAGYAAAASGREEAAEDALSFYQAALAADRTSVSARLAIILAEGVSEPYLTSSRKMLDLLRDSWAASWDPDEQIWGV